MNKKTTSQALEQLRKMILENKDPAEIKIFILKNLEYFPKDFQYNISAGLLLDGLRADLKNKTNAYNKRKENFILILKAIKKSLDKKHPKNNLNQ
ncbi:MAG: hypothetical protein ABIC19_00995 [Patescibacteria group bacterium]|nr:hypothetical protein [Patescibacteria group bacterium]